MSKSKKFKAVDFFCGAGGMTSGFKKAGVKVVAGIDFDRSCKETYEKNNKGSEFIEADITELSFKELEESTGIDRNDKDMIFIGCSPCQYWSIIKTDKSKSERSKNLIIDFQRFVDYFNPGYVVIENVPGILSKTAESPLGDFLKFLDNKGYFYDKGVINTSNYGIPQTRKRFLLVASRTNPNIKIPQPQNSKLPTVKDFIAPEKGFPIIEAGYKDETSFQHTCAGLKPINIERLNETKPNGGTRLGYANNKKLAAPSQYKRMKSFTDTYGRMSWDKPGPTITTKFFSFSNGRFGHPEQNRAISLREGATLQTFDKNYLFFGTSIAGIARQIGNAVPPKLAKVIAKQILNNI